MVKAILYLSLLVILISSCQKEERFRYKLSGVWNVKKVEIEYYTEGNLDSTKTLEDAGTWLMVDNDHTFFNSFEFEMRTTPPSMSFFPSTSEYQPGTGEFYWYGDENRNDRLTFYYVEDAFTEPFIIYTILKSTATKLKLQYVHGNTTTGYLSYKEVITLKRER